MRVSEVALDALAYARVQGNLLQLAYPLERKDYVAVAKVIEAMGGKWDRKQGVHVFEDDVEDAIQDVLNTGEVRRVKQDLGQFDTPPALAKEVAKLAQILPDMKVYEPSCGVGNLIEAILDVTSKRVNVYAREIDEKRLATCRERHFRQFGAGGIGLGDFLTVPPNPMFDRVIMNPPFAKQADITHVNHALEFLKPGGRLVAIMIAGARVRGNKKALEFRQYVESLGCEWRDVSDGAFKESGTLVRAVILIVNMPAA